MSVLNNSRFRLLKKVVRKVHHSLRSDKPNEHLPSSTAKLKKLNSGVIVYIRPSFSDDARLQEFSTSIYVPNNSITSKVVAKNPSVIFDIGANIGLSSLSLSLAFPSVTKIIGVEAESENHTLLKQNYGLWSGNQNIRDGNPPAVFQSVYAVASNISEDLSDSIGISRLAEGVSASGTFRFTDANSDESVTASNLAESQTVFSRRKVNMKELYDTYLGANEFAVLKVDIEGGENELFKGDCEWLEKTVYLTIEIHDRFGLPNSSRNIMRSIVDYDFAVVPGADVLYCYNRKILGL
ncbi:FkbM family methyltransferase [Pseudohongiella sp. SYSU M77423]|uniref:FkbM family methyltransferase n=1 Tax=Pseudohongiella sp. SYSU M77423 TaxID=3042312 RepID=UPI0024803E70|nr:FkbM family methyltransferase [Pseudohongiella sp. SYSU M77423]MDH7944940.1 FkbM family methyltransferase [Pseudohongiella sp. SYSU M77423]